MASKRLYIFDCQKNNFNLGDSISVYYICLHENMTHTYTTKGTFRLILIALFISVSIASCKEDEQPTEPAEDFVSDFYTNAQTLEIVVAYEEGAEPYVKYNTFDSWNVCDDNMNSLFSSKNIKVTVPKTLAKMISLGTLEQNNYTRENVVQLATDVHKNSNKEPQKSIIILFLDGYYIKDGVAENRILGINLDGTPTIAIFKPVIESAANSSAEKALIEQSTIVHEIGHAIGLVNKGVRATSAHHDEANGAHCTNEDCVMYWLNGGAEVQQFVAPYLLNGTVQLFGDQCIADIVAK